jgi:cyclase
MLRPRITACLLIHKSGLVKTKSFSEPKYVGDPINAVKIFNEKEIDELIVLDIDATVTKAEPNYSLIAKIAAECRMPLCYGGGISRTEQASRIIDLGVEKVAIGAAAASDPGLLGRVAEAVGRQSVVGVVDVRKRTGMFAKSYDICTRNATQVVKGDPIEFARALEGAGAGEILLNSVDRDGQMRGYDLELAARMREALRVPMTVMGGAGALEDMRRLFETCGIVGAAAGSLFVFKGVYRAVLINYPELALRQSVYEAAWGSAATE